MIRVKDLYKSFGKLEVLRGITTTIEKGEVVVIIGPVVQGKYFCVASTFWKYRKKGRSL